MRVGRVTGAEPEFSWYGVRSIVVTILRKFDIHGTRMNQLRALLLELKAAHRTYIYIPLRVN